MYMKCISLTYIIDLYLFREAIPSAETETETLKEDERIEELPSPSEEKKVSSDSAEGEDGSEEGSESEKSNTGRDFVMV